MFIEKGGETLEIERKYLPADRTEVLELIRNRIGKEFTQGYLNTNPVIRVRKEDDVCFLTYKGKGMMKREEYNLPIDIDTFRHLLSKCDDHLILKTRYCYELDLESTFIAEIDVFHGVLEGLILIEVEFPDEAAAKQFVAPSWFGKEVTFDFRYHNSNLAKSAAFPRE